MSERKSWLKRTLQSRDRNVVLICIGVAVTFWLTNALSDNYAHDFDFTIEYELQDNLSFASAPRSEIVANLSGQGWELLKTSLKRRFSHLPVTVIRPEITRSDLIAALYEHLSGYDVVVREVSTDIIQLDYDINVSRSVPLVVSNSPQVAEGFIMLGSITAQPAQVTLNGPSRLVDELSQLEVPFPSSDSINTTAEAQVQLVLANSEFITVSPSEVSLTAVIDQLVNMTGNLPVTGVNDSLGYTIDPSRVSYRIRLPSSLTSEVKMNAIQAEISLDSVTNGLAPVRLLNLPKNIESYRISPDHVRISTEQSG